MPENSSSTLKPPSWVQPVLAVSHLVDAIARQRERDRVNVDLVPVGIDYLVAHRGATTGDCVAALAKRGFDALGVIEPSDEVEVIV